MRNYSFDTFKFFLKESTSINLNALANPTKYGRIEPIPNQKIKYSKHRRVVSAMGHRRVVPQFEFDCFKVPLIIICVLDFAKQYRCANQ